MNAYNFQKMWNKMKEAGCLTYSPAENKRHCDCVKEETKIAYEEKYEEKKEVYWKYKGDIYKGTAEICIDRESDCYISITQNHAPYLVFDSFFLDKYSKKNTWVKTPEDLKELFDEIPTNITYYDGLSNGLKEKKLKRKYHDFVVKKENKIKKEFFDAVEKACRFRNVSIDINVVLDNKRIQKTIESPRGEFFELSDCEYRVIVSITSEEIEFWRDIVIGNDYDEYENLSYNELPKDIQKEIDNSIINVYIDDIFQEKIQDFYESCKCKNKYERDDF